MVSAKRHIQVEPRPDTKLPAEDAAFLDYLRSVALQCRAKPRADLFRACALLQADRTASRAAHADALMRCLTEALGQPARLHAPGVAELSFDERWLMALRRAIAGKDAGSAAFLLGRRVAAEHRRLVRFLIRRIVA